MKISSIALDLAVSVLFSVVVIVTLMNPQPALATVCQAMSLVSTSGGCPNPPTKNPTYPLALPRDVTIIGFNPFIGGGDDGFFAGGSVTGQEVASISEAQLLEADAINQAKNTAFVVLYNASTVSPSDISFIVLAYSPISVGSWAIVFFANNSSLTLANVQAIIDSIDPAESGADFIQKLLDIIKSSNANSNLGSGGGPGSNPDGSNNAAYIEIDGAIVCYGYSGIQPSTGNSFTLSPDGTTINLGAVVVNGTCP